MNQEKGMIKMNAFTRTRSIRPLAHIADVMMFQSKSQGAGINIIEEMIIIFEFFYIRLVGL